MACFFFSWNIVQVTPKIIYFHYLEDCSLYQSITMACTGYRPWSSRCIWFLARILLGPCTSYHPRTYQMQRPRQVVALWASSGCRMCSSAYRIAAKYSNKSVFQHLIKEECIIILWKYLIPQRAHHQGASNATFAWRIWYHLAKLHVCKVHKAFEYLEVIRYTLF